MLPFKPESIESLKFRFDKALEKHWIVTDPMPDRPGLHRENVFDFTFGMRLLISRDVFHYAKGSEIHVSASWEYNEPKSIAEMNKMVKIGFDMLGGIGSLRFIGFSEKAIPHWVVEMVN